MNRKITLITLGIFLGSGILSAQDAQNRARELKPTPVLQEKPFQFTFIFPPLSNNWIQNSKTINNVSINLLVGNAGGVNGAEIGYFTNTINYHVKGFQGGTAGRVRQCREKCEGFTGRLY